MIRIVNNSTIGWMLGSSSEPEPTSKKNSNSYSNNNNRTSTSPQSSASSSTSTSSSLSSRPKSISAINQNVRMFGMLEPGETAAVPSNLLDGTLSVKPAQGQYMWSPTKPEYGFSRLIHTDGSRNLLPRCRSITSKEHMYCILHIPRLEMIGEDTDLVIYMMVPLCIENELLHSSQVWMRSPDKSFMLLPGEKLHLYTLNMSQPVEMTARLVQEGEDWTCNEEFVTIYDPQGGATNDRSIVNFDRSGQDLTISLDYGTTSVCFREVVLYCAYHINNSTCLNLNVLSGSSRMAAGTSRHTTISKSVKDDSQEMFMLDQSYTDKYFMQKVYLTLGLDFVSQVFSIEQLDGDGAPKTIQLRNETHTMDIVMNIERGRGKKRRTKNVSFTPRIVVANNTGSELLLKQAASEQQFVTLLDQTNEPFYWTEKMDVARKLCFRYSDTEWTLPFCLHDLSNCVFKLKKREDSERKSDVFVYVSLKNFVGTQCIEFRSVLNPPYMIENMTGYDITVGQVGVNDLFHVESKSTLSFAWLDAGLERKMTVCIDRNHHNVIHPDSCEPGDKFISLKDVNDKLIVVRLSSKSNVRIVHFSEQKMERLDKPESKTPENTIEEIFATGSRNGHGSLVYSGSGRSWKVTGEWTEGKPSPDAIFKIETNSFNYLGAVELRNPKSKITDLSDFVKTGQGELHLMNGDFYYGNFLNDMKHGFGVLVKRNGTKYSGNWENDQFHGTGCLFETDGSMYSGLFQGGVRCGSGTLHIVNGDTISGEWTGDRLDNAVYRKGSVSDSTLGSMARMKHLLQREMDGKLLDDFIFNPYSMDSENNEAHVCKYIQFKEDHIETYERQSTAIAETLKACSADNVSDTILECTVSMLQKRNPDNFVFSFLRHFKNVFSGMYIPSVTKREVDGKVFYMAMDDLISGIMFLKTTIWSFVQRALPNISQPSQTFKIVLTTHVHNSLFSVISRLYSTMFEAKDLELNERLSLLEDCGPTEFGIPESHLPSNREHGAYEEEIAIFNELNNARSVEDMIQVFDRTRDSMLQSMGRNISVNKNKQEQVQLSADDITPVLTYVIAKSKVKNHWARSQYIYNWRSSFVDPFNPVMTIITSYSRFGEYIMELDPMQKTKEGILFSTSQVCNSLETVILSGRYDAQRLLWLPVLFSHIARKVALRPNLRTVNIKTVVDSNLNVLNTESGAEEANKVLSSLNMSLSLEPNAVVVHLDFSYNPMLFRDLALRAQQLLHRSNAQ